MLLYLDTIIVLWNFGWFCEWITVLVLTYGRESLVVKYIFVVEETQNCLSCVCVNLSKQKLLFYVCVSDSPELNWCHFP